MTIDDATTFGITTFSIMSLSIIDIIANVSINDAQHNDTRCKN
jgi:hypothetical protein